MSYPIVRLICVWTLRLFLLIITPPLFIWTLLMLCIRQFASKIAEYYKPELGKILPPTSATFGVDLMYNSIPTCPLVLTFYLDGKLNIDKCREAFTKLVNEKDPSTHELIRPQLQQHVTKFLGLLFWKWEENFNITNHVRVWDDIQNSSPILTEDDMLRIGNDLLTAPFHPDKSPWEVLIIYNGRMRGDENLPKNGPQRTTVLFRVHHALGDGYSLLKLIGQDLSGEKLHIRRGFPGYTNGVKGHVKNGMDLSKLSNGHLLNVKNGHTKSVVEKKWHAKVKGHVAKPFYYIGFYFRVIGDLSDFLYDLLEARNFSLKVKVKRILNGGATPSLPLQWFKGIKDRHSISLPALLLAGFTGGIKRHFTNHSIPIPAVLQCATVLPVPNHPFGLSNHLTGGVIRLPIHDDSAHSRLQAIHRSIEELKASTIPFVIYQLATLAGIQFSRICYFFFSNPFPMIAMSNFPGPEKLTKFIDLPILDGGFGAGFGPGNAIAGLALLSYNGHFRIACGFDISVLPESIPPKELIESLLEEFQLLDAL